MKTKRILLLILAAMFLFSACQKTPNDSSHGEITEQPEPQYMAYHFSDAMRVDDDIYLVLSVSAKTNARISVSEYGSGNFDIYTPCFDAVCNHADRSKCCLATSGVISMPISVFSYNGEPAIVIFNKDDICFSRPYSNVKVNLLVEDYVIQPFPTDKEGIQEYLESKSSAPQRSNPLVYRDYFYYVELKGDTRTQYRIPLTGGEPERVFEEDNIIVKTIINDRFYGIRYDGDMGKSISTKNDRDKIHYFRSDMNYENVEDLPEILEFFELPTGDTFRPISKAILDADREYIYVLSQKKVWAIPDSDIYAEPILLSDMGEKLPADLPSLSIQQSWYNDDIVYTVIHTGQYNLPTLDSNGFSNSTQWYESSTLYSFDIRTGECRTWDIADQNYLLRNILYADDKYVYAEGRYVHDDNRAIQGVTMRLTLDTMRYEVILPDRFWEYSAETTAG